jgi:hypothetical protein
LGRFAVVRGNNKMAAAAAVEQDNIEVPIHAILDVIVGVLVPNTVQWYLFRLFPDSGVVADTTPCWDTMAMST